MSPITTVIGNSGARGRVRAPSGSAMPFFEETFAGNQLNNANGFTWTSQGSAVVVVSDPVDSLPAVRVRYGPNAAAPANGEQGGSVELDCTFGRYLSNVWSEWYIKPPSGYVHRDNTPLSNNNKLFYMWRDTYSDTAGGTWRIGMEYNRVTGTNNAKLRFISSRWDLNNNTDSGLEGISGQYTPWFGGSGKVVLGQYNRIRVQWKAATDRTSSDGISRIWVNEELIMNYTTGKFHNFNASPSEALLHTARFMGSNNVGYDSQTDFYLRGFKFYDTDPGWL